MSRGALRAGWPMRRRTCPGPVGPPALGSISLGPSVDAAGHLWGPRCHVGGCERARLSPQGTVGRPEVSTLGPPWEVLVTFLPRSHADRSSGLGNHVLYLPPQEMPGLMSVHLLWGLESACINSAERFTGPVCLSLELTCICSPLAHLESCVGCWQTIMWELLALYSCFSPFFWHYLYLLE